jgi:hypothetical protein
VSVVASGDSVSVAGLSSLVVAGFGVFTSRGRSEGCAGLGGSGALPLPLPPFLDEPGVSANKAVGGGSATLRSRACRSTNCRATISSTELEALLTSMPVSLLSRAMTS